MTTAAFVDGDGADGIVADSIALTATDTSTIKADVAAASVAAAFGLVAASVSVGIALSRNTIANRVEASISGADDGVSARAGTITLSAQEATTIASFTIAVSVAISGGLGFAVSGAGAAATNLVRSTVTAFAADTSVISATGDVVLSAKDSSSVSADLPAAAVAAGVVAVAGAVAVTHNTIDTTVDAHITAADVTSSGGDVVVRSQSAETVFAETLSVAIAVGIGVAVAAVEATSIIDGTTQAYLGAGAQIHAVAGTARVTAISTATATGHLEGGSGTIGVAVTEIVGEATISASTRAYVGDDAAVTAGALVVQVGDEAEQTSRNAVAEISAGAGGLVTVVAVVARATVTGLVEASIGKRAAVTTSGSTTVRAAAVTTATATADGGSGGVVDVSSFKAEASVGSAETAARVTAHVGEGAELSVGSLAVEAVGEANAIADMNSGGGGVVTVGAGGAESLVNTSVRAYLGPQASRTISEPTSITSAGAASISALSSEYATATSGRAAGGVIGIAAIGVSATVLGSTQAFVGDGVVVDAASLDVAAEIGAASARAAVNISSGGVVDVASNHATARSTPSVDAHIGAAAQITTSGDAGVRSTGRAEADSSAEVYGGGVVKVSVAHAESIVDPTITASVGAGTTIAAGRDVHVRAELLDDPLGAPPSDEITGINPGSTVDFAFPLTTGDVVTYLATPADDAITGLEHLREYGVTVVAPGEIAFGSTFSVSSVDARRDIITFTAPHHFHSGDAVYYLPGGGLSIVELWQTTLPTSNPLYVDPAAVLYVRGLLLSPEPADPLQPIEDQNLVTNPSKIDPLRIRLVRTYAAAIAPESSLLKAFDAGSDVNDASNTITVSGNPFVNGQAVTYRAAASSVFFTEATDVIVIASDFCGALDDPVIDVFRSCPSGNVIHAAAGNNIFLSGHGFDSGDAVVYRKLSGAAIGGLVDGVTYYVIRISANEIQLAATFFQAVGRALDDRGTTATSDDIAAIAVTPVLLTPSTLAADQGGRHSLARALKNLDDEVTYYVVGYSYAAVGDTATFGLAATRGGSAIDIAARDAIEVRDVSGNLVTTITGLTRDGTHRVGTIGIDLRTGAAATEELRIALTGTVLDGTHRLLGPGLVPLGSVSPPPGDGRSGATAKGGGGGFVDAGAPTSTLRSSSTVTVDVDAERIAAARSVEISATSATNVSTYADTAGGGFAAVGEAHADTLVGQFGQFVGSDPSGFLTSPATTHVTLGTGITILAGDDLTLSSSSDHTASATARSLGGGVISAKIAETSAKLKYDTTTTVGADATLTAGDTLTVAASSTAVVATDSETYSVGLGAGADSDDTNGDRGAIITATTLVTVGAGAQLTADAVVIEALVHDVHGRARAKATAYSPIFLGVASAFARANVEMASTAKIDLQGAATRITGWHGIDVRAVQRDITITRDAWHLAVALIPPQNAFAEGSIALTSQVFSDSALLVTVGARDDARAADTGLVDGTQQHLRDADGSDKTQPALALFVTASNDRPTFSYPGKAGAPTDDGYSQIGDTLWDADVTVLGGRAGNSELVIDAAGKILSLRGLVVHDDAGDATPLEVDDVISDGDYYVEVTNVGYADVLFVTSRRTANDVANGGSTRWPLFTFRDSLDSVTIVDHSANEMHLLQIDVVYRGTDVPLVQLQSGHPHPTVTPMEFDIWRSLTPRASIVDIQKIQRSGTTVRSSADIVVDKSILNPAGWTRILNTDGDIIAGPSSGWIETNALVLQAPNGDVGASAAARLKLLLVQSVDRGALPATSDDVLRPIRLTVAAGGDAYLRIRSVDRVAVIVDATTVSDARLDVVVDSIVAGGTADVLLDDSERQMGKQTAAEIRVRVQTEAPIFEERRHGHFRADTTASTFLDPAAYVGSPPSPSAAIDVRYTFERTRELPLLVLAPYRLTGVDAYVVDLGLTPYATPHTPGIVAGADIVVADVGGNADTTVNGVADVAAPVVTIVGFTDVLGNGHIDVNVDGFVKLTEVAGDLRAGLIRSRAGDVALSAPDGAIVDAPAGAGAAATSGDAAADVVAVYITLFAGAAGIGSSSNFLEIDSSNAAGVHVDGLLNADAQDSIFITEVAGDLRVDLVETADGDVSLATLAGSIVDGRDDDDADVIANSIDLDANGGSVGRPLDDLEIDSSSQTTGDVGIEAGTRGAGGAVSIAGGIYVTEVDGTLQLALAEAIGGDIRITVRERDPDATPSAATLDEDLDLRSSGAVRFVENVLRNVPRGRIAALEGSILLLVGDDVTTTPNSEIRAGATIDVYGDHTNADSGYGTTIVLRGDIVSGGLTRIFGDTDVDTFQLGDASGVAGGTSPGDAGYIKLGGTTRVYGSEFDFAAGNDGEDSFTVFYLQTMNVAAGHTLTLDGQAASDSYTVRTTGSQGDARHYVVNVLDTGQPRDGVDELAIYGADGTLNGESAPGVKHPTDDIFLLRRVTEITGETADRPAFVALLHGDLGALRDTIAANETSTNVQRVNYDTAVNGRVEVYGLGGNDFFAADDNSAVTTLDGGAGSDTFQIGQIFGTKRDVAAGGLAPADVFPVLIATTRGWLSPGVSAPLVAQGGSGDDEFSVYSNQAELRLEGDDGNDFFTVRAFALAAVVDTDANGDGLKNANDLDHPTIDTNGDGVVNAADARTTTAPEQWQDDVIPLDAAGVARPVVGLGFSTARLLDVRTGAGEDEVQYNVNAPVSVDGGRGFDKIAVLGTEFADDIVITDSGVFGAGSNVRFANVESVEVDGLEGDDEFFVRSTAFGVSYRVIGGLGSDTVNVAGDVVEDIVVRDVEGASGAVDHLVTSAGDIGYDGLIASGVEVHVAGVNEGIVVIEETGGLTAVREGGPVAIDSYTVRLSAAPVGTVYVTVSAARSPQEERAAVTPGDTVWLCAAATAAACDETAEFQRHITVNGAAVDVPQRALVLVFNATNWDDEQTVYVFAYDDLLAEGDRVVTVGHSTLATDPADEATFDHAAVRNVELTIRDDDTPDVVVVQVSPSTATEDARSTVIEGAGAAGLTDDLLVSLAMAPTGTVVVKVATSDGQVALSSTDGRWSLALRTITFDASNWYVPARITVSATADSVREDPGTTAVTFSRDAATTAAGYAFDDRRVGVEVLDDDTPGVVVLESGGSTGVTLGGPGDDYTIRLTKQPLASVRVAILTDGLTDVSAINGVPVTLQAVGPTYIGSVSFSPATRRITRTDGGSWLAAGFLEGQRISIDGLGSYKIAVIRGTNATQDNTLELTDQFALPGLATGTHTIARVAAVMTFTAADFASARTVALVADARYALPPSRVGVKPFPLAPHLLGSLRGPLAVEGGVSGADRSLRNGVKLPGEKDGPLFAIGTLPPEGQQVDVLNVFADSSQADGIGTLTSTNLSGFGLAGQLTFAGATAFGEPAIVPAGISFGKVAFARDPVTNRVTGIATNATLSTIEVLNVLLGSGNDHLTVASTLNAAPEDDGDPGTTPNPPAAHGTITVIHGGGNTLLTGSSVVGGDTIVVTGGAGPGSPLVIYGDTSQDGVWYSGGPADALGADFGPKPFDGLPGVPDEDERFVFGLASPFDHPGNDVIDARTLFATIPGGSLPTVGITAYGGAGNDTIYGSQAGDFLAGGSGDDTIVGGRGADQIYGDSGVNVDLILRELSIPTANASTARNADALAAGRDVLFGDGAGSASGPGADFADVIFGDHGSVEQDVLSATVSPGYVRPTAKPERIQTTLRIDALQTREPQNGADDTIVGGLGDDRIAGGNGADTITADEGADIVFGDHGSIEYRANRSTNTDLQRRDVDVIETIDPGFGGNDTIWGASAASDAGDLADVDPRRRGFGLDPRPARGGLDPR